MDFNNHAVLGLLLLASLLPAGGCREAGQQLDVQPAVRLEHDTLPATGPVELTYVWQVAADAEPVNSDYLVFAHFRSVDGVIHWQDDHSPPIPTSQWQPGQIVEYTRIHFVPNSAPPGEFTLVVGLYDHGGSGEKVKLAGRQERELEYEVARFEVIPADQLPMILYGQGWYNLAAVPDQPDGRTYRWCQGEAVCWVEAPGRPCSLFLEVQAPRENLETAQTVTLELEGTELASFKLDSSDRVTRKIPIPERLMQDMECARLVVRLDQVMRPLELGISGDDRELGLKFHRLAIY